MTNTENIKTTEGYTVFDEVSNSVINDNGVELEDNSQIVRDAVKCMTLSSSIADTNCKEIDIRNIEMQYSFAKLACEHPEMAESIKAFADNADAADERATRRFEERYYALRDLAVVGVTGFVLYAYHRGWIESPKFPIGHK